MPILELEPTISSVTSSPGSTIKPHVNARMENSTVHAEPPGLSNDTKLESGVSNHNQYSTTSQLPFLRESLRPITLKVRFILYI